MNNIGEFSKIYSQKEKENIFKAFVITEQKQNQIINDIILKYSNLNIDVIDISELTGNYYITIGAYGGQDKQCGCKLKIYSIELIKEAT